MLTPSGLKQKELEVVLRVESGYRDVYSTSYANVFLYCLARL